MLSVRVCVSLSVSPFNFFTSQPIFTEFYMNVTSFEGTTLYFSTAYNQTRELTRW
jgi:hypothetical protein